MTLKNNEKFEEKLPCRFKIDMRNLTNFDPSTWKSQTFAPEWESFWSKYIIFDLKQYRGVIFRETESDTKFKKKTNLRFRKWHDDFGKFSPEHSKVSKLGLWMDPFIQSRKFMSLKFTEELCVMTMKNDSRFEEELICQFKIVMRNSTNF